MRYKVEHLITRLAGGADLPTALRELELTPAQALVMLRSPRARRLLGTHRRLARIHSHLVAQRYSSYAVARLCELVSGDKPELRLKGALALLGVAGLKELRRRGKSRRKEDAAREEMEPTAEDGALTEKLSRLLQEPSAG